MKDKNFTREGKAEREMFSLPPSLLTETMQKIGEALPAEDRFCCYCDHVRMPYNEIKITAVSAVCAHPSTPVGKTDKVFRLIDGRERLCGCMDMRSREDQCGMAGKWFERKRGGIDPHAD